MVRLMGITTAIAFTALVMVGVVLLIASDFMDVEKQLDRAWQWYNAPPAKEAFLGKMNAIEEASDITFFASAPIVGSPLEITTGISFANAEDIADGKANRRWCYIQAGKGNFTERLDLGARDGEKSPTYVHTARFSSSQLSAFKLTASQLGMLAKSHCLLNGFKSSVPLRPRKSQS